MKLFLVALAALVTLVTPALPHDSWISKGGHRNPGDEWCCGVGDCGEKVAGEAFAGTDGWHVNAVFLIEGGAENGNVSFGINEVIPYAEAQPSPDGEFWACRRPDGTRRCFFAPPPST